jgi:hypothetical protein
MREITLERDGQQYTGTCKGLAAAGDCFPSKYLPGLLETFRAHLLKLVDLEMPRSSSANRPFPVYWDWDRAVRGEVKIVGIISSKYISILPGTLELQIAQLQANNTKTASPLKLSRS